MANFDHFRQQWTAVKFSVLNTSKGFIRQKNIFFFIFWGLGGCGRQGAGGWNLILICWSQIFSIEHFKRLYKTKKIFFFIFWGVGGGRGGRGVKFIFDLSRHIKKKRQGVRSKFDHFHNKIVYKDFKYHKKMILSPAIFFFFFIYIYIFF